MDYSADDQETARPFSPKSFRVDLPRLEGLSRSRIYSNEVFREDLPVRNLEQYCSNITHNCIF